MTVIQYQLFTIEVEPLASNHVHLAVILQTPYRCGGGRRLPGTSRRSPFIKA